MKTFYLFFGLLTFVSLATAQGSNYLAINETDFMIFDTSDQDNYVFFEISEERAFTIHSGRVGAGENYWEHPSSSGRLLHSDPESGIPKLKTGLHKAADMVFLEANGRVTVYNQYLLDTTHIFLSIQDYGSFPAGHVYVKSRDLASEYKNFVIECSARIFCEGMAVSYFLIDTAN